MKWPIFFFSGVRKNSQINDIQSHSPGFTIVEMMIAAALMQIVILAFTSFLNAQLRIQKQLAQKYDTLNISSRVGNIMLNPNHCTCQLPNVIDTTAPVSLSSLKETCDPGAPFLLQEHSAIAESQYGLKVSTMSLENMSNIGSDLYKGDLIVRFDIGSSIAALSPIKHTLYIKTLGSNPNALYVAECGRIASSLGSGGLVDPVTLSMICLSFGGAFNSATQSCTLSNAPPPPGTVVAGCTYGAVVQNCYGGALKPNHCPSGTTYQLLEQGAVTGKFQCVAN